jgi:hypothetical protein
MWSAARETSTTSPATELNTKTCSARAQARGQRDHLLKFMVVGMALSAFWAALVGTGVLYLYPDPVAALHAGRKQPTMTAPAKAAKLKRIDSDGAVSDFVDGDEPRPVTGAAASLATFSGRAVLLVNTVVTVLMEDA